MSSDPESDNYLPPNQEAAQEPHASPRHRKTKAEAALHSVVPFHDTFGTELRRLRAVMDRWESAALQTEEMVATSAKATESEVSDLFEEMDWTAKELADISVCIQCDRAYVEKKIAAVEDKKDEVPESPASPAVVADE